MTNLLTITRRPDLTFTSDGRIHITARVARILSLAPGDYINIATEQGEYFLFATRCDNLVDARHQAQCYPTKSRSHNFRASSAQLVRALFNHCGITARRASFLTGYPIDHEGTIYLPIITRRPIF